MKQLRGLWTITMLLLTAVAYAELPPSPVLQTGQTSCASYTGECAGTRQDGELRYGLAFNGTRFSTLPDNTVRDNLTGLIWHKPSSDNTFQGSLDYVKSLGGDWRLPNLRDLESLSYTGSSLSWLNASGKKFWAATTTLMDGDAVYHYSGPTVVEYSGPLSAVSITAANQYSITAAYALAVRNSSPLVPRTGQTLCYSDRNTSIEPLTTVPCAGTAQDGEVQAGALWEVPRFVDNGNQTITDRQTGLIWSKSQIIPEASGAGSYVFPGCELTPGLYTSDIVDVVPCLNKNAWLGKNDWRVANAAEMRSLVNHEFDQLGNISWLNTNGFNLTNTNSTIWNGWPSDSPDDPYNSVWPVRGGVAMLTVTTSGNATGTVSVDAGDISWNGNKGMAAYNSNTSLVLTALPDTDTGAIFNRWIGCDVTSGNTCNVTINRARNVTAEFGAPISGVCGNANGSYLSTMPSTALCSAGSPSAVTGSNPWNWSCTGLYGGAKANCQTAIGGGNSTPHPLPLGGVTVASTISIPPVTCAGLENMSLNMNLTSPDIYEQIDYSTYEFLPSWVPLTFILKHILTGKSLVFNPICYGCSNSIVGNVITDPSLSYFNGDSANGDWELSIQNWGGSVGTLNSWGLTMTCLQPVDGQCGAANNTTLIAPPNTNLCISGTSSAVSGSGPWSWSCNGTNGGTMANCSANVQTYQLTLTLDGTGGGSISGGVACTSGSACQPATFGLNTPVTLIPLANSASTFTSWSGACTNASGNCSLIMDGAKTVIATFTAAPRVKVGAKEFSTIQAAHNDAATVNNSVIKLLEGTLTENVIFNRNIGITLYGGYNAAYDSVSTETTIQGPMKVRAGTVSMKRINIK